MSSTRLNTNLVYFEARSSIIHFAVTLRTENTAGEVFAPNGQVKSSEGTAGQQETRNDFPSSQPQRRPS